MSEKIIVKDLQKLDPGSELVELYEVEFVKDNFAYFTNGIDDDESTLILTLLFVLMCLSL